MTLALFGCCFMAILVILNNMNDEKENWMELFLQTRKLESSVLHIFLNLSFHR